MPELPEVEVTRLGIAPYLEGHSIEQIVIRNPRLRWPIRIADHRDHWQLVRDRGRYSPAARVDVIGVPR